MWRRYHIIRFGEKSAWGNRDIEHVGEIVADPTKIGSHYPGAYTGPVQFKGVHAFFGEAYLEPVEPQ
jgi:hypothetical protein